MALDLLLRRFLIHSGGIQLTTAPAAAVAPAATSVGRWGRRLSGLHGDPLFFVDLIKKNNASALEYLTGFVQST